MSSGIRRSFTLLCDPIRSDQAARDIRKKKTEYISDAAQRQKVGQIEDASQTAEYHDVLQQEADLTSGHGVLRYTGLIAISATSSDELEAAVSAANRTGCNSGLVRNPQASGPASTGVRRRRTAAVPRDLTTRPGDLCRGLLHT